MDSYRLSIQSLADSYNAIGDLWRYLEALGCEEQPGWKSVYANMRGMWEEIAAIQSGRRTESEAIEHIGGYWLALSKSVNLRYVAGLPDWWLDRYWEATEWLAAYKKGKVRIGQMLPDSYLEARSRHHLGSYQRPIST